MTGPRTGFTGIATFVCGILGVVLFMWIPKTGRGFLIYGVLLVLFVLGFIFVLPDRHEDEEETGPPFS